MFSLQTLPFMRHERTAPYGSSKGGDLDMCVNIHNENQCSETQK